MPFPRSSSGGSANATSIQSRAVSAAAPNNAAVPAWIAANNDGDPPAAGGALTPAQVDIIDTLANRGAYTPPAGVLYLTSDTGQIYRGTGAGWTAFTPLGTDTSKLAIASNLSDLGNRQTA